MTIEAGALALRITETGADQVLAKLNQIDAKARGLGKATQTALQFNAPSMTGVNGQLQAMSMNFTQVAQGANAATGAINNNAAAQQQHQQATKSSTGALVEQLLTFQAARQIMGDVGRIIAFVTDAADNQTLAQRRLSAVSRLTGADLAFLKSVSADAQKTFRLSQASADDLTGQFAKLADRAGHVSMTGAAMNAWLDLGAANGLTLDQTLQALTTTLGGNDEGLNKLGLMNPGQIWKKWADAAGMTVGQMTDAQKWQAILNEVVSEGTKVNGEYVKSLNTVQGSQNAFNEKVKDAAAIFGHTLDSGRSMFYGLTAGLLDLVIAFDKGWHSIGASMADGIRGFLLAHPFLARLAELTGDMPAASGPAKNPIVSFESTPNVNAKSLQAQLDAAAGFKRPGKKQTASEKREAEEIAAAIQRDERLSRVRDILATGGEPGDAARMVGLKPADKLKGEKGTPAQALADANFGRDEDIKKALEEKRKFIGGIMQDVAGSLASSVTGAFQSAFEGGNFLVSLGKGLLSAIGGMIVQLGESMLTYGTLMAVGAPLLMATPFAAQALSAPAAIAAGIGLIALGAGMGAIGGKGGGKGSRGDGGGGRGGTGQQQKDDTFAMQFDPDGKLRKAAKGPSVIPSSRALSNSAMPDARANVTVNATVIDPDDPRAQTQIAQLVKNAVNRGKDIGMKRAS